MKSIVDLSHEFLKPSLHAQAICIDATLGHGHDTEFFLQNNVRKVYAFEIQEDVLNATEKRVSDQRLTCLLKGHEHMDEIEEVVDAIIFNFGYCPHGDETITTLPETSLEAVKKGLDLLKNRGRMALVFYPHDVGKKEEGVILDYLLSTKHDLLKVERLKKTGPYFIGVEKRA